MKLRFQLVDEHYISNRSKHRHKKHLPEFPEIGNMDSLEEYADKFCTQPVNTSNEESEDNIIGCVVTDKDDKVDYKYIKYDKNNNIFASYLPNKNIPCGILLFTIFKPEDGIDYYKRQKTRYIGEIPRGM